MAHCDTPWKIVAGHHPLVSNGGYHKQKWVPHEGQGELLKQVLVEGGAAAYLCGHDHSGQLIVQDGVAFVISGNFLGGGRAIRRDEGAHEGTLHTSFSKEKGARTGFVVLDVNFERMVIEFYDQSEREQPIFKHEVERSE